jgi:hypothetical protein
VGDTDDVFAFGDDRSQERVFGVVEISHGRGRDGPVSRDLADFVTHWVVAQ